MGGTEDAVSMLSDVVADAIKVVQDGNRHAPWDLGDASVYLGVPALHIRSLRVHGTLVCYPCSELRVYVGQLSNLTLEVLNLSAPDKHLCHVALHKTMMNTHLMEDMRRFVSLVN